MRTNGRLRFDGLGLDKRVAPRIVRWADDQARVSFVRLLTEAYVKFGGAILRCPSNTLIVVKPGAPRWYGNDTRTWRMSWLHCGGRAVLASLRRNGLPFHEPLQLRDPYAWEKYLLEMFNELTTYREPSLELLESLLRSWVVELKRAIDPAATARRIPARLAEVKHHIDVSLGKRLSLRGLAQRAGLSVSHFSAEFRTHFGFSPVDYVIRLRLNRAALLLRDRDLNVTQIGRAVGYPDLFHFSKAFKNHFGKSPTGYRAARRSPRADEARSTTVA